MDETRLKLRRMKQFRTHFTSFGHIWHSLFSPPSVTPAQYEPGKKWLLYVGIAAAVGLTLVLYLNTLSLPFFQDDVVHIRWQSAHNVIEPFITAKNLPIYRPLGESLMKIWWLILGRNDPALLRLQNILTHALNAVLVALLVLRIDRSKQRFAVAGIAAVLFAAFPFSYQAVVWINVFFYPLGTCLLLMTALIYWRARERGSMRWLLLAWLLCFLAAAEIEYGLMTGVILLGVELLLWVQRRQPHIWWVGPAVGLLINVIFYAIWRSVPRADYYSNGVVSFDLGKILHMGTYYIQGLVYPAAPAALPLGNRLALDGASALGVVTLIALGITFTVLIWKRRIVVALLGFGWFVLFAAPPLISVNFEYVINSPRLLYPTAPGITLIWALLIVELVWVGRWRKLRLAIVLALTGLVLVQNYAFIQMENRLYHLAAEPVDGVAEAAQTTPHDEALLFINLPAWLSPHSQDYALGNHGAQFIAGWASINDVIFAANGEDHFSRAASFTALTNDTPYWLGLYGPKLDWNGLSQLMLRSGSIYLTQYEPDRIRLLPAGRVTSINLGDVAAQFRSDLQIGATQVITSNETIEVILNWRVLRQIDQDLTVFVHLYAPDGQLVAQADGYPLLGLAPFWSWAPGQTLQDRRTLSWPVNAPAGAYRLGVGIYDRESGQRVEATSPDGTRLPDDTLTMTTLAHP